MVCNLCASVCPRETDRWGSTMAVTAVSPPPPSRANETASASVYGRLLDGLNVEPMSVGLPLDFSVMVFLASRHLDPASPTCSRPSDLPAFSRYTDRPGVAVPPLMDVVLRGRVPFVCLPTARDAWCRCASRYRPNLTRPRARVCIGWQVKEDVMESPPGLDFAMPWICSASGLEDLDRRILRVGIDSAKVVQSKAQVRNTLRS
jgi:hypothetical protein